MFRHRLSEPVKFKTYIDWLLLACLGGAVNAGGYLACHRFVTHVTGFVTLTGIEAGAGQWLEAFSILTVPAFFLMGVMASAFWIDRAVQEGKKPRYALVMGLVTVLLLIAGIGGATGWFGPFGSEMHLQRDYIFLVLLCGASGLQNAALSSASGSTIRTTHLTGLTTDLGIGLVRYAALPARDRRRPFERRFNFVRFATIFSFMLGSTIGTVLYLRIGYLGFIFPATIAAYAAYIAFIDGRADASPASVPGSTPDAPPDVSLAQSRSSTPEA